jgi:tRNA-specific 2-thiouridylase
MSKVNPYTKAKEQSNQGSARGALPGAGKKVVVAMSGGVDSSVAALLLKQQGYEVVGIALQTTDYSKYREGDTSGGTCCSIKDMEEARRVAEIIGIPFYVLDTEKTFDTAVVSYFINDYLQGRTPNPCVMCNTKVKFNHLYKKAMDMGADYVATGHYAKVSKEPDYGYVLWKSTDLAKDQTYFLFNLTQRQLEKTLFPLGNLTKPEVRRIALEFKLPVAEKPDSQEICFVPGSDYAGFIERRVAPSLIKPGYFITVDYKVIMEHDGIYKYTVGQRKGLGRPLEMAKAMNLPNASDYFVVKIDAIRNHIILGTEKDLQQWGLLCSNVNWVVAPDLRATRRLKVKIRYRAEPVDCDVRMLADSRCEVRFVAPQRAITPGQACVFYDGNMCLGGGWILEALAVEPAERARSSAELSV